MAYVKSDEVRAAQEVVKNRVLTSALVILARSGIEAVTIRNVAKRAKCAIGMVYKLYPGKDEILAALANRKLTEDLAAIENVTKRRITPRMQLAAALAVFYAQMRRPRLTKALFEIPQYREGVFSIFRGIIGEGMPGDDPELATTLVVSVLYGVAIFAKPQESEVVAMAALRAMGMTNAVAESAIVNARYETANFGE